MIKQLIQKLKRRNKLKKLDVQLAILTHDMTLEQHIRTTSGGETKLKPWAKPEKYKAWPIDNCTTLYGEYVTWCRKNASGPWNVTEDRYKDGCWVSFYEKKDAMYFKLIHPSVVYENINKNWKRYE